MQLVINNKTLYNKAFIYNYLPRYIENLVLDSLSKDKLKVFDLEFKIDSLKIIKKALRNLSVVELSNSYIISIDKNKKYKNVSLDVLVNLITYGNRTCKGYKIIYDVFNLVAKNLDIVYKEWLE